MRSFRIGKHKVRQSEFDDEVLRLYKGGLEVGDYDPGTGKSTGIAGRLRRERTTIWRSLQRTKADAPAEAEQAKKERIYYKETSDEFQKEPLVAKWVEDMHARRVGGWKGNVSAIKSMCDDLGIFPDQLDLEWGRKWLVMKKDVPLEDLRSKKVAARSFYQSQGISDYDLTQAGFDAKHYAVGKWKHVKFTNEQIQSIKQNLRVEGLTETLFVFNFGLDTCRTLEPIWNLEGDRFYTLQSNGKTLYAVNLFRKKTEKSGGAFKTAYMSKDTYDLAQILSRKNGGLIMNGCKPHTIYDDLRAAYKRAGVTIEYFYMHPIHALRHAGAQWWLERTGFNRAVVAEIGGWEAEITLEMHYGGVPVDIIRGFAGSLL